ncbi:AMP-binding protein (plasmid) [Rhodococcus sp. USK10]|uniref:class I adenylate-forming enzyme family protein n=1 Tax=Rhodococcus sp. USK10 TaxID=2789739 RepID=UPI001C5CDA03|nr:AMP-binding protein [Rhodococcus sp. USK10]QYB00407.1 AMP-binding protein [Rhodococcus sp. USK10]
MNIGLAFSRNARREPDALACFAGTRSRTWAQVNDRANRLANLLIDRYGVARGDRVAVLVANRMEVLELVGGCAKAGAVYVGLNFRLGEPEYADIFTNCDPKVILADSELAPMARRLTDGTDTVVLDIDDPTQYETQLSASSETTPALERQVGPDDDFCIVYSSGTTGRPKGILFSVGATLQHAAVAAVEYELTPQTRWMITIPHNSSMQITLAPLTLLGGAIGFSDSRGFKPERFVEDVQSNAVTHTFLVPTMLIRLLESEYGPDTIPTLQTIGYGSAPIAPDRVAALVERFGPIFVQLYGMAEIASIGTMLRKSDHALAAAGHPELFSTCGKESMAVMVRLIDDTGADVPPGERGEIVFGTPYTMVGYYREPERTAEVLLDGWMHSGDIGQWTSDGYLKIVGRKKDLIIRGGFNIAPTEIENVLTLHEQVREAAVVGLDDPEWGEAIAAVVVVSGPQSPSVEELRQWCRAQGLPSIKVPERIEVWDELPRNAVGKITKAQVREKLASPAGVS